MNQLQRAKMGKIYLVISLITILFAEDDFFIPGYSIGGYGELHYNRSQSGENAATTKLDFHRFIIYYGYAFSEEWSFKSEVELEHNFVHDGEGELELEQAYINYYSGRYGFQAGVILPSVGIINESHEPPLFISVERPEYSTYVIPTTWFGNGAAVYGKIVGINWRFVLMEDLNGDNIRKGFRSGRVKGYKSTAYDLVKNFSGYFNGVTGLRVGGSMTFHNAPTSAYLIEDENGHTIINAADTATVGIQLLEVNAKYNANNIYAVLEYGQLSYKNNPLGYETSGGYYIDLGYDVGSLIGLKGKLLPWMRVSGYNLGNDDTFIDYSIIRYGLTFWPISEIVFKFELGKKAASSHKNNPDLQLNVGVGYSF